MSRPSQEHPFQGAYRGWSTEIGSHVHYSRLQTPAIAASFPSQDSLSDTVGFIRNLPHTLVTSFRATLEEVERAEILLHVQDAASPIREEQKTQVEKVLTELAVSTKPVIHVLNKVDLLSPQELTHLSIDRDAIPVSSLQQTGIEQLIKAIDTALVADPVVESSFRLPQSEGSILASLEAGDVIGEKHFEVDLVFFRARGPASLLDRYRRFHDKYDRGSLTVALRRRE